MIETITLKDWRNISDLEIEFPLHVFRGQSDADWELSSSISRFLRGTDYEHDPINSEFWLLREFRSRAGQYITRLPEKNDAVAWLSLMQHHGAPTRLIDFTHSFYVALYFALIGATKDAAVWAIDPQWLLDIGHKVFRLKKGALRDEWEDKVYDATNAYLANAFRTAAGISDEEVKIGAVAVSPIHHHIRSGSQQGLFVIPLDVRLSLLENLQPSLRAARRGCVRKILIQHDLKEVALAHLREMNITAETLFPGLDGFARSLVHKHFCM